MTRTTRTTFRIIQLLFLAATATATTTTTTTTTCPSGYHLSFVEDYSEQKCNSLEEFHSAFQQVYRGFQSYLEVSSYTTQSTTLGETTLEELLGEATQTQSASSSSTDSRVTSQGQEGSYQLVSADAPDLQVLECLHSDYCGVVTTRHCRRTNHKKPNKRGGRQQQPQPQPLESACDWIARQELPGCLRGATLICQELFQQDQQLFFL